MSNTSFRFKHIFLLSAHSSQCHATLCASLMSHHRVNNKCNRVKGQRWRRLIYALRIFLLCNMLRVFRSNHHCSWKFHKFQRKTPVSECFFLKMMKLYRHLFCMNKTYFCRNFHFLVDWRHKHLKNIVDLLLFYGENYYGFLGSDLRKKSEKNIHFTIIISIYTGHRHFEVFLSFILYIL